LTDFFTQLAVGLVLTALIILYWGWRPEINRLVRPPKPSKQPVGAEMKDVVAPSLRDWRSDGTPELDPRFSHVYAVLFYPPEISWEKGDRTPTRYMPRYKAIVNDRTKKAFYMVEYAIDLLNRRRIQWYTETWKGDDAFKKYFKAKGITLIGKPATEADLLEDNPSC